MPTALMPTLRRWSVVLALACVSSGVSVHAGQMRVGISGSPPFVIKDGSHYSGISVDIWDRVAEDNDISYKLIEQPTPKAGIEAVDDGSIDLLVGPISITSSMKPFGTAAIASARRPSRKFAWIVSASSG